MQQLLREHLPCILQKIKQKGKTNIQEENEKIARSLAAYNNMWTNQTKSNTQQNTTRKTQNRLSLNCKQTSNQNTSQKKYATSRLRENINGEKQKLLKDAKASPKHKLDTNLNKDKASKGKNTSKLSTCMTMKPNQNKRDAPENESSFKENRMEDTTDRESISSDETSFSDYTEEIDLTSPRKNLDDTYMYPDIQQQQNGSTLNGDGPLENKSTNHETDFIVTICDRCHEIESGRETLLVQCEMCKKMLCAKCAELNNSIIKDIKKWNTLHFYCLTCDLEVKLKLNPPENLQGTETNEDDSVTSVLGTTEGHQQNLSQINTPITDLLRDINIKISDMQKEIANLRINHNHSNASPAGREKPAQPTKLNNEPEMENEYMAQSTSPIIEEYRDRERRKNNIILHNVEESTAEEPQKRKEDDRKTVSNIINEVLQLRNIKIIQTIRLGQKQQNHNTPRVLLVQIDTNRDEVLSSANKLRHHAQHNRIFIDPDRTPAERATHKQLRIELKERRANGERCTIKRGRIITLNTYHSWHSVSEMPPTTEREQTKPNLTTEYTTEHKGHRTREEQPGACATQSPYITTGMPSSDRKHHAEEEEKIRERGGPIPAQHCNTNTAQNHKEDSGGRNHQSTNKISSSDSANISPRTDTNSSSRAETLAEPQAFTSMNMPGHQ